MSNYDSFFDLLKSSRSTVVLTGAGISTLSGIPDFRSEGGVYSEKFGSLSVESLLDIDFFLSHPEEFYAWARNGWYSDKEYKPNVVHNALVLMEKKGLLSEGIFTQNIDSLHTYAGSGKVYELHGTLRTSSCTSCHRKYSFSETRERLKGNPYPKCDYCHTLLKPDIVFYGESLDEGILNRAYRSFENAELCIVLGTSLVVNPVATLPWVSVNNNKKVVIVNRDETYLDNKAQFVFRDLKQWGDKTLSFLQSL